MATTATSEAHTANEGGWLNVGQQQPFDLSWLVRPGTVVSSLVTGVLGLQPWPVLAEALAWVVYLVPMLLVVLWPQRRQRPAEDARPGVAAPDPGISVPLDATRDGLEARASSLASTERTRP